MQELMRTSLLNKAQEIFSFLEKKDDFIYKSDLSECGLDSHSAEQWLALIEFIQKQPKLLVKRAGRFTTAKIEK